VKNVEWDGVYTNSTYTDPTSGAWQTINGQGWSFGHNFKEWLYLPSEMLLEHRGICIEHSKLGTALLRALDIPARPVSPYGTQFWAQLPSGEGYWVGMSTSGGRSLYKTNGDLFSAFESYSLSSLSGFPVDNGPWIHSDWYTENKCLWREVHPWSEQYEPTPEGLSKALSDLAKFAATGEAPVNPPVLPGPCYYIDYSDFTLDLRNIGNQRELNARFPLPVDNGHVVNLNKFAYFSDHPECVVSTWVDSLTYPHVKEKNLWFSINFDLSPLLPAPEEKLCDIKANGEDDILYLRKGEKLELTISTDPQSHKGEIMDYWVTATTPLGWYSYVPKKWQKGLTNGYRGSLIPLTNYNLSESSSLPTGAYTFFFSVDSPDGIPQGTFSDHVQVIIR
jgi:hypothetical protein